MMAKGPQIVMPVRIRGITYASVKEAAAALGCSASAVYGGISRGNIDAIGLGCRTRMLPLTIDGVRYACVRAAAVALECQIETVRKWRALAIKAGGVYISPRKGCRVEVPE